MRHRLVRLPLIASISYKLPRRLAALPAKQDLQPQASSCVVVLMSNTNDSEDKKQSEGAAGEEDAPRIHLDREVIREMKRLGHGRPKGLPVSEWNEPLEMNHRHDEIITLMLCGYSKKRIAEQIGMAYQYVVDITNSPLFKHVYWQKRKERDLAVDRKRLHAHFDDALEVMESVMLDEDEKGSVRLDAAKYIVDQAIGKAKQDVEVKGTVLMDVMHSIEQLRQVKDATPVPELDKPKSKIDSFVEAFIPDTDFAVGKRGTSDEQEEV
jgi:hypothetical protein